MTLLTTLPSNAATDYKSFIQVLESGKKLLIKPANFINLEECHNILEEQERERRIAVNDEQRIGALTFINFHSHADRRINIH